MGDRKAFEAEVLKWVNELDPSGMNGEEMKKLFAGMSDQDIERYVVAIETGKDFISMNYNNLKKSSITVKNNLRVAKLLGHNFFQRLWLTDPVTEKRYLTPIPYMVIDVPVRRQVQMLTKKMSVPDDNLHVDELTNQPTDVSKGSAISFPELLVLYSQGLDSSILEFIKLRGGDDKAYNAVERLISEQGSVNTDFIMQAGTKVKSTETLSAFFKAMHLDNNLAG